MASIAISSDNAACGLKDVLAQHMRDEGRPPLPRREGDLEWALLTKHDRF